MVVCIEWEIVKKEKNELVVEIKDGDETLPVLITSKLWDYEGIAFAGYQKEHPLIEHIKLVVKAKDAPNVLKTAVNDLIKDVDVVMKHIK